MKELRACLLITSLSFVACTYLVRRVGRTPVLLMGVHTDITTGNGKKLKSMSVEEMSDNIPWLGLRETLATSLPQVSTHGDEQAKRSLLLTGRELGDQEVLLHISCCELFRWNLSAWHCSHKKC